VDVNGRDFVAVEDRITAKMGFNSIDGVICFISRLHIADTKATSTEVVFPSAVPNDVELGSIAIPFGDRLAEKYAVPEPRVFFTAPASAITLANINQWQAVPGMSQQIKLTERRLVIATYSVCTHSPQGPNHLCTRLDVDGKDQASSHAISGDVVFWSNVGFWSECLDAGIHTFTVCYRTPASGAVLIASEWQGCGLRVVVS